MVPLIDSIPVIYYHSVGPFPSHWSKKYLNIGLSNFESQLIYLSKHYNPIHLKEYYNIIIGDQKLSYNPVVITFDDGYLDNWIWAFPLLRKYNLKATIFVSTEFVDKTGGVRYNLLDYQNGKCGWNELYKWGFLSWEEMYLMEQSGLMDIQSHTSSHTKYFVSDKLSGIHHPGADSLYAIGNLFPRRRPYYINDESFEKLIPFGYPLFEEKSSVIARRVFINQEFIDESIEILKDQNINVFNFKTAFTRLQPLYNYYKSKNQIISRKETELEQMERIENEISGSKKEIEKRLSKKVEFLCWPHGDNDNSLHLKALKAGYLMTTKGKAISVNDNDFTRIRERTGIDFSRRTRTIKSKIKLKAFSEQVPFSVILRMYRRLVKRMQFS